MSIWNFAQQLKPSIDKSFQLTLNEGETPCNEITFLTTKLHLKREDLNPHGSHKDRGIAYQLAFYRQQGFTKYVLSSSGNTAISALHYCHQANVTLYVFLSSSLSKTKIFLLNKTFEQINIPIKLTFPLESPKQYNADSVKIFIDNKPVSKAFKTAQTKDFVHLRGSTDPQGTIGYQTIAFELVKQIPIASQIFIPCSSGTAAQGIIEGYNLMYTSVKRNPPQLHCVQTTKTNIISREFDNDFSPTKDSKAKAIVDKVGHRQSKIIKLITNTNGFGWTVDDQTILKAYNLLGHYGINSSYTGALGFAGIIKAQSKGYILKNPVVIITGTNQYVG